MREALLLGDREDDSSVLAGADDVAVAGQEDTGHCARMDECVGSPNQVGCRRPDFVQVDPAVVVAVSDVIAVEAGVAGGGDRGEELAGLLPERIRRQRAGIVDLQRAVLRGCADPLAPVHRGDRPACAEDRVVLVGRRSVLVDQDDAVAVGSLGHAAEYEHGVVRVPGDHRGRSAGTRRVPDRDERLGRDVVDVRRTGVVGNDQALAVGREAESGDGALVHLLLRVDREQEVAGIGVDDVGLDLSAPNGEFAVVAEGDRSVRAGQGDVPQGRHCDLAGGILPAADHPAGVAGGEQERRVVQTDESVGRTREDLELGRLAERDSADGRLSGCGVFRAHDGLVRDHARDIVAVMAGGDRRGDRESDGQGQESVMLHANVLHGLMGKCLEPTFVSEFTRIGVSTTVS